MSILRIRPAQFPFHVSGFDGLQVGVCLIYSNKRFWATTGLAAPYRRTTKTPCLCPFGPQAGGNVL